MMCKKKKRTIFKNLKECPADSNCNDNKINCALWADIRKKLPSKSFCQNACRTFFWILKQKKRASITLEAALVVPLFILMSFTMYGVMDLYKVHTLVRSSIHESAMDLAEYAYIAGNGEDSILEDTFCALYGKKRLPHLGNHVKVSMAGSGCRNEKIYMKATISYKLPVSVMPLPALVTTSACTVRCWTGWDKTDGDMQDHRWKDMVYVTDEESVYHTSADCTYLDLDIHKTEKSRIGEFRNRYGEKYYPCECCKGETGQGDVFYTTGGTKYHADLSCPGLKRNVRMVIRPENSQLEKCERCRKRDTK